MNVLSKVQALMAGFLLLVIASILVNILFLAPAALLLCLQFAVFRSELKGEYPEDWRTYMVIFLLYEGILMAIFYAILNTPISYTNLSGIQNIFILAFLAILIVIVMKFLIGRGHCYGTVIFSTKGWAGVHIKSDLFSRVKEANYAVENPLDLKVKKGDRVRIRVKAGITSYTLSEIEEVVRRAKR